MQFRPDKGAWQASADRLEGLIQQAADRGAQLIVCPEMALTGYLFPDAAAAAQVADPADGRTFQRFSQVARRCGAYLVLGYPEAAGALYNAALVLGPDGSLLASYRKRLLYEADESWATPGDGLYPLLPTPFGLLSVAICMDLNDDRFIDFLHEARPQIVAFCTNWIHEGFDIRPYWRMRLRGARCFFAAADTYGTESAPPASCRFLGRSAILDPNGRTLALAGETGDEVIVASLYN